MFHIKRNEQGFAISWENQDDSIGNKFRLEASFQGLTKAGDWELGTSIARYRNELETLKIITDTLSEIGATYSLDAEVEALLGTRADELSLLKTVRKGVRSKIKVPASLPEFRSGRRLLPYQRQAVDRHLVSENAADFSVPGSGKTTVALAYWSILRRSVPNLGLWIIGPLSSFRPWEDEFEACFGSPPKSVRLRGTAGQRSALISEAEQHELVLSSYHGAWRDSDLYVQALRRAPWLVVLDESHYIKSPSGTLSEAVRQIGAYAYRRMILTGTPMPRDPMDLWSQFTFLWPSEGLLGNSYQHELRCKNATEDTIDALASDLRPFFYRTCKSDLGLPPIRATYPVIDADRIPPLQRLIIRLIERRTLEESHHLSRIDRKVLRRWRRARIIRLLQAASNPLLLLDALTADVIASFEDDEDDLPESVADTVSESLDDPNSELALALHQFRDGKRKAAKIQFVEEECRSIVAKGEKVVIWTTFLGNVDSLAAGLADLNPLTITGQVPLYEAVESEGEEMSREERIHEFKTDPRRMVLIANTAACAESISLHRACQHAIYLERSFNAAQFLQSLDRIHRQGMPKGKTAAVAIPSIPCAVERVLNRRLAIRQERLYKLLDDTMPVIGFDDEAHRGLFDIEDVEDLDQLFAEVLAEIRKGRDGKR